MMRGSRQVSWAPRVVLRLVCLPAAATAVSASVFLPVSAPVHLSVLPTILLPIHPPVLAAILPPIILSVFPAVVLSILLPVCPPIFLPDISLGQSGVWSQDSGYRHGRENGETHQNAGFHNDCWLHKKSSVRA